MSGCAGGCVDDRAREHEPQRAAAGVPCSGRSTRRGGARPCRRRRGRDRAGTAGRRDRARRARRVGLAGARVDAEPDDDRGLRPDLRSGRSTSRALGLAPVREPGRGAEHLAVDRELQHRLVVRGGVQHGTVGDAGESRDRGVVEERVEGDDVGVGRAIASIRPGAIGPCLSIHSRCSSSVTRRPRRITRSVAASKSADRRRDREPVHLDAVDLGVAGRVVVGPGVGVERARGERFDGEAGPRARGGRRAGGPRSPRRRGSRRRNAA